MRIREMTAADIDAVSELRVRSWRFAYEGLMPKRYLAAMSPARYAEGMRQQIAQGVGRVGHIVAEDTWDAGDAGDAENPDATDLKEADDGAARGTIVGWAVIGPYRQDPLPGGDPRSGDDRLADDGELYALHVRSDLVGGGIGRALMTEGMGRLAADGFARLRLWVVRDNVRARRFYERMGCILDGAEATADVGGTKVPEVRYVRPLQPADRFAPSQPAPDRA